MVDRVGGFGASAAGLSAWRGSVVSTFFLVWALAVLPLDVLPLDASSALDHPAGLLVVSQGGGTEFTCDSRVKTRTERAEWAPLWAAEGLIVHYRVVHIVPLNG